MPLCRFRKHMTDIALFISIIEIYHNSENIICKQRKTIDFIIDYYKINGKTNPLKNY